MGRFRLPFSVLYSFPQLVKRHGFLSVAMKNPMAVRTHDIHVFNCQFALQLSLRACLNNQDYDFGVEILYACLVGR
jgi:hypothetical protein